MIASALFLSETQTCLGFVRPTAATADRYHRRNASPCWGSKTNPSRDPRFWWKDDDGYWFHEDIHTLGNTGLKGGLHAAMAPLSTRIIDLLAYKGKNIRKTIAKKLVDRILSQRQHDGNDAPLQILDLGCGVGMSTMSIASAVRNKNRKGGANAFVTGVDTSPEMLAMARARDLERKGIESCLSETMTDCRNATTDDAAAVMVRFVEANAEGTPFSNQSFDLVTIMYVLHEAPFLGRHRILREARRLLKPGGILAVVDIAPGYEPSGSMLSGEPYLKDYQNNLAGQLSSLRGFEFDDFEFEFESERDSLCKETIVVPGHVVLYSLVKSPDPWWKRLSSNGWIRRATEFANVHSYLWNRLLLSSSEERPSE